MVRQKLNDRLKKKDVQLQSGIFLFMGAGMVWERVCGAKLVLGHVTPEKRYDR